MPEENFLNGQIISRLNLEYLPEEARIRLLDKISEVIQQRTLLKVFERVGESKREALGRILDKGGDGELEKFMGENVPNFLEILQTEIDAVTAGLVKRLQAA